MTTLIETSITKTGVFISWSSNKSAGHYLAEKLSEWLPNILQNVETFLSSENLGPGSRWFEVIEEALSKTKCCIVIATAESLASPWVHYEAGAMAVNVERKLVMPLLYKVTAIDMERSPLKQFQGYELSRESIFRIVATINEKTAMPITAKRLEDSFEAWWPKLEKAIEYMPEAPVLPAQEPDKAEPKEAESTMLNTIVEMLREVLNKVSEPDRERRRILMSLRNEASREREKKKV